MKRARCPHCMEQIPVVTRFLAQYRVQVCPYCGTHIRARYGRNAITVAFVSVMLLVQVAISFSRWIKGSLILFGTIGIVLALSVFSRIEIATKDEVLKYERSRRLRHHE